MAKKKVFSIGNTLAEGLEETLAAGHNYSGELRIDIIPLKKIEVDPENPRNLALSFNDLYHGIHPTDPNFERKQREKESLLSLASSIKDQGLINPILVYKSQDGYKLIAGERRTLASIMADKTDIQAKILDGKPDTFKVRMLQWYENIERNDLSLAEKIDNLEKIIDAYAKYHQISKTDITVTEMANLLGCAKSHAINLKALLQADGEIKQLIKDNKIKNIEKAALLINITSPEVRAKAIIECIEGAPLKKLKALVKTNLPKDKSKRGRKNMVIQFGKTEHYNVAKIIFESILNHEELAHLRKQYKTTNFQDYRSMSNTFKHLIKTLEKLYV